MKLAPGLVLASALLLGLASVAAAAPTEAHDGRVLECLTDVARCAADASAVEDPAAEPEAPADDEASLLVRAGLLLGAMGALIGDGAEQVAEAVGKVLGAAGQAVVGAMGALAAVLLLLRPEAMPVPVFAGVAAVGTAAAVGGAQAGLWALWRRWGTLLGSFLLPLFSRIEKDEVLEHERRARIFELIKQRPGIHLSEIGRTLDLAWGSTLHHLRKLREQRLIQIRKVGHHKCYFLNGSGYSEKQMEVLSLLKNQTLADVAAAIEAHPDSSLKDLSRSLGISSPLAAHHVRRLERAGMIRKTRAGKEVRLAPTDAVPRGFFNGLAPHACAAEGAVGFA